MEMGYNFKLDDEVADLIQSTLPEGVSIGIAGKVLLMGWACSNCNNKTFFEAIGRMQYRKTLRETIKFMQNKNIGLRIKAIEDFLNDQEQKALIKNA